jgi:hypothetical protein
LSIALLELALFSPDDPAEGRFFSFLIGIPETIASYLKVIDANVRDAANRPPLIPSPRLYDIPYWAKAYEEPVQTSPIDLESAAIHLVRYAIDDVGQATFAEVAYSVELTFDKAMHELYPDRTSRGLGADFATLVPIFRPAAQRQAGLGERIRGGGLFIYGRREGEWWPIDQEPAVQRNDILRVGPATVSSQLWQGLMKGIMGVSYSRVDQARRERDSRDSAFIANAHEINKFVSRIHASSPLVMLDLIRVYFQFMFSSDRKYDLLSYLNEIPFLSIIRAKKGRLFLDEIIANAFLVAAVLESALYAIGRSGITPDTQTFESDLRGRLAEYAHRLESTVPHSAPRFGREDQWLFFGALVCVFKNTLQHDDTSRPISVALLASDHLLVRNGRVADNATTSKDQASDPKGTRPGKTVDAVRHWVRLYSSLGAEEVDMDLDPMDPFMYQTFVPLPGQNR